MRIKKIMINSILKKISNIRSTNVADEDKRLVNSDGWLKRIKVKTFIDIGAYIGEYVDFAEKIYPGVSIFAFEPLEYGISELQKKKKINPNIEIFNMAIGDKNKKTIIYESSYKPSSSLLPMLSLHKNEFPHTSQYQTRHITVRKLDDIMKGKVLDKEIFIKIDTQGYEDKVLAGGGKTIKKAAVILIEVSFHKLYKGQILFHELYQHMHDLGFVLFGFRNQVISPQSGLVLQAHAYFVNKEIKI